MHSGTFTLRAPLLRTAGAAFAARPAPLRRSAAGLAAAELRASLDEHRQLSPPSGATAVYDFETDRDMFEFVQSDFFAEHHWERRACRLRLPAGLAESRGLPVDTSTLFSQGTSWAVGAEPRDRLGQDGDSHEQRNIHLVLGSFQGLPGPGGGERVSGVDVVAVVRRSGCTAISHAVQLWDAPTAALCLELAEVVGRPVNANLYTAASFIGEKGSAGAAWGGIEAHNDPHCVLILQLAGRKRWDLWHAQPCALPVNHNLVVGKRGSSKLKAADLGVPDYTTELEPGDVLYVPRGGVPPSPWLNLTFTLSMALAPVGSNSRRRIRGW
jgi:hypothetical protein